MLKAEGKETHHILQSILQDIWTKGDILDDRRKGVIIKVTLEIATTGVNHTTLPYQ